MKGAIRWIRSSRVLTVGCVGRTGNRCDQINPKVLRSNLQRITSSSLDHLGAKRDITPSLIIVGALRLESLDYVITEAHLAAELQARSSRLPLHANDDVHTARLKTRNAAMWLHLTMTICSSIILLSTVAFQIDLFDQFMHAPNHCGFLFPPTYRRGKSINGSCMFSIEVGINAPCSHLINERQLCAAKQIKPNQSNAFLDH